MVAADFGLVTSFFFIFSFQRSFHIKWAGFCNWFVLYLVLVLDKFFPLPVKEFLL
jgi:hypothetical protein